jgi:hypothetical protein
MVPPPAYPGLQFELANYASKIRALSTVWFLFGAAFAVLGFLGMAFANAAFHGGLWWMHGPMPPFWMGRSILHFAWVTLVIRCGLAVLAGWGLMERAQWGRIVAIIAGFANLFSFPIGTALGIWTLIMLMGYRNATLYEQLPPA